MRPIDRSLLNIFASEQAEHLERIRSLLDMLANSAGEDAAASLEEMQRRLHTLKGAAHAVGLESTEVLIHGLETAFTKARQSGGSSFDNARTLAEQALAAAEDILAAAQTEREAPNVTRLQAALAAFAPGVPPLDHDSAPALLAEKTASAAVTVPAAADSDLMRVSARRIDDLVRSSSDLLLTALLDSEAANPFEENAEYLEQLHREWQQMRRGVGNSAGHDAADTLELHKANRCLNYVDRQLEILRRRAQTASDKWEVRMREVRRRAENLYADACAVRMTPADTLFSGFGAMVRELAQQQNKPVEFRAEGLETQADRMVLQMLKDPVLHLLRNAVSHGAEPEQQRAAAGKPQATTIRLRIQTHGDRLNLSVEDDGRGIDTRAVIEEAMRRGVLTEPRDSSTVNVAKLLLVPGLSTAKQVTSLAGRGIGLSVVQDAVARLHGDMSIRPTPGGGTAILITVPVAMSTQHVLFVDSGGFTFAIPAAFVEQLLRIPISDIHLIEGQESVIAGGRAIRLVRMTDLLSLKSLPAPDEAGPETRKLFVVIVVANEARLAVAVDAFRDEREAIIKDTGLSGARAGLSAGAVPMDDGSVAVVLSVTELFSRAGAKERFAAFVSPKAEKKVASILVVDDSITTRSLEKSILESHGYRVRVAVDGLQALELIGAEAPDLVISDVMMPRMTGFELLAAMKGDPAMKSIPVILVTSIESSEEQARGLELGADAYIVKHRFDQRELMQIVRQIV